MEKRREVIFGLPGVSAPCLLLGSQNCDSKERRALLASTETVRATSCRGELLKGPGDAPPKMLDMGERTPDCGEPRMLSNLLTGTRGSCGMRRLRQQAWFTNT
mmetsp:Transcript_2431/g.4672  ORF Transcript_2431/g.4672 Transcript_2431/m.4672 type:complete len:103 (-) Transcript_2431:2219-2527(-)